MTRRQLLRSAGNGFGMLGLASLLAEKSEAAGALEARSTHFPAKAKHVIFLFMNGGPSHVDTFDPKPALAQYDGQTPAAIMGKTGRKQADKLMASPFKAKPYGHAGIEVSELYPEVGGCIDAICVLRS